MANTDNTPATRVRRSSLEMVMDACADFAKVLASHGATVAKRQLTMEDVPAYKELEEALNNSSSLANGLIRDFSIQLNAMAEKHALLMRAEAAEARIAELEERLRVAGQGEAQPVAKGGKTKEKAA